MEENENKSLHKNHFLLTGTREKLIQVIMASRGLACNEDKALELLEYQVHLFKTVANVMTKVDLPREFWDKTLARMEKELMHAKQ